MAPCRSPKRFLTSFGPSKSFRQPWLVSILSWPLQKERVAKKTCLTCLFSLSGEKTLHWGICLWVTWAGRRNRPGKLLCVEVFSGRSAIYLAHRDKNLPAERFDTRVCNTHNIHTREGVWAVAKMFCQLCPKWGYALVEPTCSSWGWINRGASLRSVVTRMQQLYNCFNLVKVFFHEGLVDKSPRHFKTNVNVGNRNLAFVSLERFVVFIDARKWLPDVDV